MIDVDNGGFDRSMVGAWMTPSPISIGAQETLQQAELSMAEHGVRHLPVVSGGRAVGVLSERDVAQVRALCPGRETEVAVIEAMTPAPYMVGARTPLAQVAQRMAAERYGCAVVVEGKQEVVVGIFTTIDALRALSELLRSNM